MFKTFDEIDREVGPDALFTNYGAPKPKTPAGYDTPDTLAAAQEVSNRSTFGAAFSSDNTIGSLLSRKDLGVDNDIDPNFDPVSYIKDNKLEGHESTFYGVMNGRLADARRDQIKMEQEHKQTLDASGWTGTFAQIAAGVLDAPTLVPGTIAVKGAAGGFSVARSALMAGVSAGATQVLTEGALHATQETRMREESAVNVGASVVLGSLLGGSVAALLGKNELIAARRAAEAMGDINGGKVPNTVVPDGEAGSLGAASNPYFVDPIDPTDLARNAPRTREALAVEGAAANAAVKSTAWVNPVLRATQRYGATARQFGNDLYENTIYRVMHGAGDTTGQSVEALARTQVHSSLAQAFGVADEAYSAMRKGGGGQLSRSQFNEEIGRAMRRNDESDNPFVAQAAKGYRKLFDGFTDQAIKVGILDPEDLDVKTAASYFSRVYNVDRLTASEAEFLDTIGKHYADGMAKGYAEDADKLTAVRAKRAQQVEDISLSGADRTRRIDEIQKAGEDLDARSPDHVDRASDLAEARSNVRQAQGADKEAARAEVKRILDEGGSEFQDYLTTREELRRRMKNLRERNPDAQAERGERLARRIDETQELAERSTETYGRQAKNILNRIAADPVGRADELISVTERQIAKLRGLADQAERRANETKAQYVDQMNPQEGFDRAVANATRDNPRNNDDKFEFVKSSQDDSIDVLRPKGTKADDNGSDIGLSFTKDENGYNVNSAYIPEGGRGKGTGSDLYRTLIRRASSENKSVFSDATVSRDAIKIYERLKAQGYNVERSPNAVPNMSRTPGLMTEDGSPVFTVRPGEPAGVSAKDAVRAGNREADRITKQIADAERAVSDYRSRADRLDALNERLAKRETAREAAQDLAAELEQGAKDAAKRQAGIATRRGEALAELKQRAAALSPEEISARLDRQKTKFDGNLEKVEQAFDTRWGEARAKGLERGEAYDFEAAGRDVARQVFDTLTGRAAQNSQVPGFLVPITRGPLKDRTFLVPDELLEGRGWLKDNVQEVAERYARQVAGEIELTRRFGKADLSEQIAKVQDEYSNMQVAAAKAGTVQEINAILGRDKFKARANLEKAKLETAKLLADDLKSAVEDMNAARDLIRGSFGKGVNNTNFAAVSRIALHFNYLAKMGGVLLSNAAEFYRPAMVHGIAPYMRNLPDHIAAGLGGGSAGLRMSLTEAQLAGVVVERVNHAMAASIGDLGDPFLSRVGGIERMMQKATRGASRWNLINHFTDAQQAISSTLSQHRILEAVAGNGGKDGSFVDRGTRLIRLLGIDERTQADIAGYVAQHGQRTDGIQVANTERWLQAARETGSPAEISRAENAVRTYRTAVNTDVNSIVSRRGLGDAPLFANTPMGKLLLQFSGYTLGAHSRVMIRGLQEDKVRLLGGLIAMSSIGAMASYLSAWRAGQERWEKFTKEIHDNPAKLIGEGLDRSGFFPLLFDVSNRIEKITGAVDQSQRFNPIKSTLSALGGGPATGNVSTRGSDSSGAIGAIAGPTAGLLDGLVAAGRLATDKVRGQQSSKRDFNLATGIIPYNSYFGAREMLQALNGNSPWLRR